MSCWIATNNTVAVAIAVAITVATTTTTNYHYARVIMLQQTRVDVRGVNTWMTLVSNSMRLEPTNSMSVDLLEKNISFFLFRRFLSLPLFSFLLVWLLLLLLLPVLFRVVCFRKINNKCWSSHQRRRLVFCCEALVFPIGSSPSHSNACSIISDYDYADFGVAGKKTTEVINCSSVAGVRQSVVSFCKILSSNRIERLRIAIFVFLLLCAEVRIELSYVNWHNV